MVIQETFGSLELLKEKAQADDRALEERMKPRLLSKRMAAMKMDLMTLPG